MNETPQQPTPEPIDDAAPEASAEPKQRSRTPWIVGGSIAAAALLLAVAGGSFAAGVAVGDQDRGDGPRMALEADGGAPLGGLPQGPGHGPERHADRDHGRGDHHDGDRPDFDGDGPGTLPNPMPSFSPAPTAPAPSAPATPTS